LEITGGWAASLTSIVRDAVLLAAPTESFT